MTRNGRNDIREALVKRGIALKALAVQAGVSHQRVAQCIDDPNPQHGRRVKALVAQRLRRPITDLWPTPASPETTR